MNHSFDVNVAARIGLKKAKKSTAPGVERRGRELI